MKKPTIEPRGKYVLIKPDDADNRESEHGIISPDSVEQEQKAQGIVIAVGADIADVKKGDHVIYGSFAGEGLKMIESAKKVDFKLIHTDDIIAFIRK